LALKTRKDLEIHLITRALKDESFRAELIANPKAVIESELGSKLSDELEINVLEETEDTIYMVLPCNPYEGMSEEELQASLGMTYEDVALWVLEQNKNALLGDPGSATLISRVWEVGSFKQELLNNPKEVLEKELGTKIPETIEVQILEETTNKLYLLLPRGFDTFDFTNEDLSILSMAENVASTMVVAVTPGTFNCTRSLC
jgi:hypothetical protein